MGSIHRCCEIVMDGNWPRQCYRGGKIDREGKRYCKQRDPVAVAARREVSNAKWKVRWGRDRLRDRVRDARDKIADAVLECFHNDVEMPAPI